MKKILSILILGILLIGLVAPMAALAAEDQIKECCKISQKIDAGDPGVCNGGDVAAPDLLKAAACNPDVTAGTLCPSPVAELGNWGMFCLLNVVYIVTNWIFYLMMIGVVIVFVIAGAMYMMSSGDPEKTKSAKNLMIFAIVGLIVALIAKLVPSVVKLIVAM